MAQLDSEPQAVFPDLSYASPIDLDGDGRDEVVGVSVTTNALVAYSVGDSGVASRIRRLADVGSSSTSVLNRWELQVTDLNGDGVGDLLGTDAGAFRIFYGLTDGTFAPSVEIEPIMLREQVEPMDLDADGDLDLVLFPPLTNVGFSGPLALEWIENLGGGAFASRAALATGADDYQGLDPIDVDGDGDTDLAGFRGGERVPVIVRNMGTSLQAEALPGGLPGTFASQPGDVDGDGDVDLLVVRVATVGQLGTEIDLYRNDAGAFQPPTVVLEEPDGFRYDLTLANVDGAGANELIGIVVEPGTRVSIRVYPWTAQGVYGPAADEIDVSQEDSFRGTLATGSFDSDQMDDLFLRWTELATSSFGERFSPRVYRGDSVAGAPAFAAPTFFAKRAAGRFQAADLDGDGILDLIQSRDDQLQWKRGRAGSARFGALGTIAQAGKLELLGDFNGDGRPEILLTRENASGAPELLILENLGAGAFGSPITVQVGLPANSLANSDAPGFEARDFDLDGDLDILPSGQSRTLEWSENLGGLSFAAPAPIAIVPSTEFNNFLAADLNGDGELDYLELEFALFTDSTWSWFEGLGGGAFGPSQPVLTTPDAQPDLGDVNGDGIVDLIYVEPAGIFALLGGAAGPGTGSASGGPVLLSSAATNAANLELLDINDDGLTDLVETSAAIGTTSVPDAFLRVGPLSFDSAPFFFAPTGVGLFDFGGDGDLDGLGELNDFDVVFEGLSRGLSGASFCGPAAFNSSGSPARLTALGTTNVQLNELLLRVDDAPAGSFGFFLASQVSQPASSVPGSAGRLCLGGQIGRYVGPGQVQSANAAGTFQLALDLNVIPTPVGPTAAVAGATWFFQAWFRDMGPTGPTSNFSDGTEVLFD